MNIRIGAIVMALLAAGCGGKPQVVVYTALDQMYSEPILKTFEQQTGIMVRAVYDSEGNKTTGLFNRLLVEAQRPVCDVFWSNEHARTLLLKTQGVLAPVASSQAERFPEQWRDPEGYWYGFAGRMRVLLYNTQLVPEASAPTSLYDLADPQWRGKAAIGSPMFGTTATHLAALWAVWGASPSAEFCARLQDNQVTALPGNAQVRDAVVRGDFALGLTDTDDAYGALDANAPVRMVIPDQLPYGATETILGAYLIPNSVAVIKNCPHPDNAQKLLDYLLSPEVEQRLAELPGRQIPLGTGGSIPEGVIDPAALHLTELPHRALAFSFAAATRFWYAQMVSGK